MRRRKRKSKINKVCNERAVFGKVRK